MLVDGLPTSPVARALVDACRDLRNPQAVRALAAEAVQRGRTTVARLDHELARGGSAGSGLLTAALDDVRAGARSAPEAQLRRLIARTALPTPALNADLNGPDGRWLAPPDMCWPGVGLAVEVESVEWHLGPAQWQQTMRRRNRMEAASIAVLQFPPSRLRREPAAVVREIVAAYGARLRLRPGA